MNRKDYLSDTRYAKVLEHMDLLGIMDISTTRQSKNGTIVWKLPIKDQDSGILIEIASFKTGYVRNQGKSTRSNFQLNKRIENQPTYYKDYEWVDGEQVFTGKYQKFTTRGCKLIPIEIDRLEYLISYCLKNYYIKNANQVPNGNYVPKWKLENSISAHEYKLEQERDGRCEEVADFQRESDAKIRDLEEEISILKEYIDRVQNTVNNG